MERADKPGYWQSVTGSIEYGETLLQTAVREVWEETGILFRSSELHDWRYSTVYEIYAHWRHRYPKSSTHNTEHLFSAVIPIDTAIRLSPEHTGCLWLPAEQAAEKVFSPSNRDAILRLIQP